MIIPMLEAVSAMLPSGECEIKEGMAKVECAKLMLDKIIEGMKEKKEPIVVPQGYEVISPDYSVKESTASAPKKPTLPEKRKAKEDEVEICVDGGRIQSIKNAKDDTMIELDGIAHPWRKAIGMSFTEGKVL